MYVTIARVYNAITRTHQEMKQRT